MKSGDEGTHADAGDSANRHTECLDGFEYADMAKAFYSSGPEHEVQRLACELHGKLRLSVYRANV